MELMTGLAFKGNFCKVNSDTKPDKDCNLRQSPWPREAQEVWAGWVVSEVDWELAEWQSPEALSLVGGL